ncbi:MAG: hypothetical protein V1813_01250 [Candidatus Aenigmatarchaeota archaeon]
MVKTAMNNAVFEPEWVAELGHAFYAALSPEDTESRHRAYRVIDDFYMKVDNCQKDSNEWKYMTKVFLSAQSLGSGKLSRKSEYRESVENAKAEMDKKLDLNSRKTYVFKIMNSLQTLVAGIGTYFITKGLLNNIDPGLDPTIQEGISFGAAYTVAETTDAIEGSIRQRKVKRITGKCEEAKENARLKYRKEVTKEYDFALKRCRTAWVESFGGEPPNREADVSWLLED